jgi:hypothetical protein
MPEGNVPYKFTVDAEAERQWKRKNRSEGSNFTFNKFDKEAFRDNYDEIDWSAKGTGGKK